MPGVYLPPPTPPTAAYVEAQKTEASAPAAARSSPAPAPSALRPASGALHFHAVPLAQVWTLKAGETISHGLEAWGAQAHWTVVWQLPRDWSVPATTSFTGSFEDAAENVLKTLSAEGVLLKGEIYEGNHTLVVKPTGEKE